MEPKKRSTPKRQKRWLAKTPLPPKGFPPRRLLRRDPQILKMSWHQALKIERLLAPKGLRFMVRSRRLFRRRR